MLLTILVFIFILSLLVLIHEFGHFITARKSGVKVEEFGLGIPPRIWHTRRGGTIYSINAIPLGGFVKLYGEDKTEVEHLKDPESFTSKSSLVKALIISAGVVMNLLLAVVLFYFLMVSSGFKFQEPLMFNYQFPLGRQQNFVRILIVADDSPAQKAGIQPQDIIIGRDGIKFERSEQLVKFINENKGKEVSLKIKKSITGEVKDIKVVPRVNPPKKEGPLGVGLEDFAEVQYGTVLEKASVGFLHTFNLAHYSIIALGHFIKISFSERTIEPLSETTMGPVGILALTKVTMQAGFMPLLNLIAFISLALAIINIFPFPALDGGRLAFVVYEFLTKRTIPAKVENAINLVGFALLIVLFFLVTYKDIIQFKEILF